VTEDPFAFEGPVPSRGARAFRALRHHEFRRVWGTFIVAQFGFWVSFIAMQALMSRLTDADGTWLGLLFFCSFSPILLFTPAAGVIADRLERRRIVMVAYGCMSAVMATLAAVKVFGQIRPTTLLLFSFATGTIFAFAAPANTSITVNSVPHRDLPSAISLQASAAQLARVIGPTVAAPLIAVWDEGVAFGTYALAAIVVVLLLSRVRLSSYVPEPGDVHFLTRVRRGIEHARERPPAVAGLSVLAMSSLFAAAYLSLLPVMADQVFDKGPTGFATLAAVAGIGSALGAFTTAFRDRVPTLRSTALLVAAFGASVALFSRSPSWTAALITSVVVGVFYFSGMTTLNTLLQSLVDENMRGRISSLFLIGWAGLVPIGGLWQGIFSSNYGVRLAMTVAGCTTAVYSSLVVAAITFGFVKDRRPVLHVHEQTFLPSEAAS
jgi:MFS family permease